MITLNLHEEPITLNLEDETIVLELSGARGPAGPPGDHLGMLEVVLGDSSTPLLADTEATFRVPFDCTVTAGALVADVSGSASIAVWVHAFPTPPTGADVVGVLVLSAARASEASWNISLTRGDLVTFHVNSATTVKSVLASLSITRTG